MNHRKILECVWPCLGHLYGKLREIINLKALGNYSDSIWSYNFSMRFWERQKTLISMVSGFLDVPPAPKTNYFSLETPGYLKKIKNPPGKNRNSCVLQISKNNTVFLSNLEKTGADKNPTIRQIHS